MINSLINQKYFLSQKLQKEIFAIICSKKINTIIIGGPKGLGKRNFVLKLAKFILCNLEIRKNKIITNVNLIVQLNRQNQIK